MHANCYCRFVRASGGIAHACVRVAFFPTGAGRTLLAGWGGVVGNVFFVTRTQTDDLTALEKVDMKYLSPQGLAEECVVCVWGRGKVFACVGHGCYYALWEMSWIQKCIAAV